MASTCKSCGAAITWIRTRSGRAMPCDATQVYYRIRPGGRDKVVTLMGDVIGYEIIKTEQESDGAGYVPHWATCSTPEIFKKR